MSYTTRGLYRSRNGWIFGVCQGLSDKFDLSVFWIRMALVIATLCGAGSPVLIYLVAALIMRKEPYY